MQFIKSLFGGDFLASDHGVMEKKAEKMRVGILGTGKIGADLLAKVQRSPLLECVIFSGRNLQSSGMQYAAAHGVPVSDQGIDAFFDQKNRCDIVFDATSAAHHIAHAQIFDQLGLFVVDMTPSQIGECCVPALGMNEVLENRNISMISCGGQSSIPVARVLADCIPGIKSLSVKSVVSPDSIGPGTLANIDEYYRNTRSGLQKYTGINNIEIDLQVDPINSESPMLNTICVYADSINIDLLVAPLAAMLQKVQEYVPGYKLYSGPELIEGGVKIELSVEGVGDYLPTYAGNLDIINCAAIAVAEHYVIATLAARYKKSPARQYHSGSVALA